MASYHRLSTTLKAWANYSRQQIESMVNSNPAPAQDIDEEFYERRRCEFLNDFNDTNNLQIIKEAIDTMAFNEIEPIIVPDVGFGEREPYQEVKAHLISPFSNRISAASRSVCDNWISQRGFTPLLRSSGPDNKPKKYYSQLGLVPCAGGGYEDEDSIPWSDVVNMEEELWKKLEPQLPQIIETYRLHVGPYANPTVATYILLAVIINYTNHELCKRPFNTRKPIYIHHIDLTSIEEVGKYKYNPYYFIWAAEHSNKGYFASSLTLDIYLNYYFKVEHFLRENT